MKKKLTVITAICYAFFLSNCNNSNKIEKKEPNVAMETEGKEEKCVSNMTASDSAKFISKQLNVKGEVERTLSLTVDSLKQMKTVEIDNYQVVCQTAATGKPGKSSIGVLLKDIISKAMIKQNGHKDRNFYIVAEATDGYKATFSWAELFNNPTGDNTYVIFEENGKPITNKGQMVLICRNDIKTGPRHVIWLKSIEVNRVK